MSVKIGEWVVINSKDEDIDGLVGILMTNDGTSIPFCVNTDETGMVWCTEVIEVEGEGWRQRELAKIVSGHHVALPQQVLDFLAEKGVSLIKDHFTHQSRKSPCSCAFTQNEDKGERDIQTPMKFGRYLNRYYSDALSGDDIKACVEIFNSFVLKVEFATTRDEIRKVYENGPDSCMGKETSHFKTGDVHPCEPYAGGDLAIAYMGNSARCLVWPDKKIYGTVYGNDSIMHALENDGYSPAREFEGGFHGARLLRIEVDGRIVIPYIDGDEFNVEIYPTHLEIDIGSIHNSHSSHSTGGFLILKQKCSKCSEALVKEDIITIEYDSAEVCPYCRRVHYKEAILTKDEKSLLPKDLCFRAGGKWYRNGVDLEEFGLVKLEDGSILTRLELDETKLSKTQNFKTSLSCIFYMAPYKTAPTSDVIEANTTLRIYSEERVGDWVKVFHNNEAGWISVRRGRFIVRNENPLGFNLSLLWDTIQTSGLATLNSTRV